MSIAVWTFIQGLSFTKRATFALVGSVIFGASLTTYVMFLPGHPYLMQVVASCIKVPALLILCPLLAIYPTFVVSRLLDRQVEIRPLLKASFSCVVGTAIFLGVCAPAIALLNETGNYTIIIFASYATFGVAGLIGCAAFYFKLKSERSAVSFRKSARTISTVWLVLFGLIGAEVGWSIRPFVGWTGQPFEWYRSDSTHMWQQLYTEALNLRVGGLSFPTELEKPAAR